MISPKMVVLPLRAIAVSCVAYGLIALMSMAMPIGTVQAQETKPKQETRKTPAIRNAVYEKMAKAQKAMDEKNYAQAEKVLDEMISRHKAGRRTLNSYELANVWSTYAFLYYTQEKFGKAISANEQVIKQPNIPLGMETGARYTVAQLYFVVEDYAGAVKALEQWFKVEANPSPDAYVLLSQGYYQIKEIDKSLSAIEKAMAVARAKGKEPKEQWYLVMRALYFEKGNNEKMTWVLEQLVQRWPKRDYFVQLSSMYAQLNKEDKQLAAHDIAKTGWGLESEGEQLNMAYLYMGNSVPYKGAQVLEKGLKNGSVKKKSKNYMTLSQALTAAQESKKALPYIEKAAELSDGGNTWAELAGVYFDNERYNDAIKAGKKALAGGDVKRPENTHIVIGMSLFNLKKLKSARAEFRKAQKAKRTEKVAKQWIKYINGELKRLEDLSKV